MFNPRISCSYELIEGQILHLVGLVKLLNAAADRPLRMEFGQRMRDLIAIDPVATEIRPPAFRIFNRDYQAQSPAP